MHGKYEITVLETDANRRKTMRSEYEITITMRSEYEITILEFDADRRRCALCNENACSN